MLTKEQRAHDLALTVLRWKLDHINETMDPKNTTTTVDENGKKSAKINVYGMYSQDYKNFLTALGNEFDD